MEKRRKWVTREKAKVDRVACPWLIKNFVDSEPEFLFVPADKVSTLHLSVRRKRSPGSSTVQLISNSKY